MGHVNVKMDCQTFNLRNLRMYRDELLDKDMLDVFNIPNEVRRGIVPIEQVAYLTQTRA